MEQILAVALGTEFSTTNNQLAWTRQMREAEGQIRRRRPRMVIIQLRGSLIAGPQEL